MRAAPKNIDIMGKEFSVTTKKMPGLYGKVVQSKSQIYLSPSQSDDNSRDTLLHEVIHAVDNDMQCGLTEEQVTRIATGLYQVIRHNPEFVAFLVEPNE